MPVNTMFFDSKNPMGSKPVREAHMMKYGSTLRHLDGDFDETHMSRSKLESSCARLAKPKRCAKKFAYESRNKGASGPSEQMDDLFPAHSEVEEVGGISKEVLYPEDWRRLPEEIACGKLEWLYESVKLDIETPLTKSQAQLQHALSRALKESGSDALGSNANRKDIRAMVRTGTRFGVLVDIIATRRNILSGVPHELANFVYKFLEAEYPVSVRFIFVGITDNATKLVAKDIFDSRGGGRIKRLSFGDIDGDHLFVAYPRENAAEALRERGVMEREQKELEHRMRTWTPKYVPPLEPTWMKGARREVARAKAFLQSADRESAHSSWKGKCSRCWSHNSLVGRMHQSPCDSATDAAPSVQSNHARIGVNSPSQQGLPTSEAVILLQPQGSEAYSPSNCVERLRELRRCHREEKGRVTVVKEPVELLKVVHRLAEKSQQ